MKPYKMKSFRFPIFRKIGTGIALSICLLFTTACKVDANSQAKTDASQEQTAAKQETSDQQAADVKLVK